MSTTEEQKTFTEPAKDIRKAYASSLVADLEAYAKKHDLFLGKKPWVQQHTWTAYHNNYQQDHLYLDAILFTGITCDVNNLECVVLYDSSVEGGHFEFGMVSPDFRETYANDPKWGISLHQAGKDKDGNDKYDLMFGKEFRCFKKARVDIGDQYPDFGYLDNYYHKWTQHVPEEALDLVMDAFREINLKHARRLKNQDSLEKKKARIKESEDRLTPIADILAPLVGEKYKITTRRTNIAPSESEPISVELMVDSGVRNICIDCDIRYTPKRDIFRACLRHPTNDKLGSEPFCWYAEGGIPRMVAAIGYAMAFCQLYDETCTKLKNLKELYSVGEDIVVRDEEEE